MENDPKHEPRLKLNKGDYEQMNQKLMEVKGAEELAELNCEESWCFIGDKMEATTDKCIPKIVLTRNRWKQANIHHKTMAQYGTVRPKSHLARRP